MCPIGSAAPSSIFHLDRLLPEEPTVGTTGNMNLLQLSQRIREMRTSAGLTLEELAEKTGMTRGVISKIENFRVTPSLPTLAKIAEAFGVSTADLLAGLDQRPQIVVVRKEERQEITRDGSAIRYFALAHKRAIKLMEPMLLEIQPGKGRDEKLAHEGEEFVMVVDGTIEYEYGDESYRLEPGDCIYDDGSVQHTLRNVGRSIARLIVVYAKGG